MESHLSDSHSFQAVVVFEKNVVGPIRYRKTYERYSPLLNGNATKDKDNFLKSKATLQEFQTKMDGFMKLKKDIQAIRNAVLLNLFVLDCGDLNRDMISLCEELYQSLIRHQVNTNRTWNRNICNQFDGMATKLGEIPDETKELVELQRYLKTSMNETMPALMARIEEATQRVLFLLGCTILPMEDIQLNTRVFQWPKDMASVFELAKTRTGHRRDQVEDELRSRIDKFEAAMKKINRELETFTKKDPPVLTMDEMRSSVQVIDKLAVRISECTDVLRDINREEVFLDWDPSEYQLLGKMRTLSELFGSLWHVALEFHEKYERWYNGPLNGLDAADIQKQVSRMYEKSMSLSRTFLDHHPSARRIAETIKSKIEKFRVHLPVLHTLCNPGLRERHWKLIEAANAMHSGGGSKRVELKRGPDTSLADMIEAGLHRVVSQLEEIGATASKEYALEMAMAKMKDEWLHVVFECVPYRESGVSTLTMVEEIQQMLDDHILKAQTMHSSAYIKPFEEEMKLWEDKLISMQDILDAWLRCQESWLYLEPIFNSEDIMKQMPVEGRKFNKVDRIWRNIMAKTVADPHVLQATNQPNMLANLNEANELLDAIMKGLNDYLEKKRLFFPRFFFLSNDELLEILSETKDPLRVQPHVKKCFEGIDRLKFAKDKNGNQDIVGMISKEGEEVEFCQTIYPADAKGMVEKWLLQVEKQMVASLKDVISRTTRAYLAADFSLTKWALAWPGQAVLCGKSINWTAEAVAAIKDPSSPSRALAHFLAKCNEHLSEIVSLVRTGVTPSSAKILRSLIVIGTHARDVVERLKARNVVSTEDFVWASNMRYYLPGLDGDGTIRVEMVSTSVHYAFEYLGANIERLVVTAMTERCHQTLMGALKMNLGGAPEGPAGSGKTEMCKDLAKAVAKQCVVFNCSDGIDFHAMGKFLKGMAQSGAWICFDEFNRINMDVLSVVAQQISTIQTAVASGAKNFFFEGAELTLNPSCNIFITMNPDCGTGHAIPDNLKLLFRPVATIVPDVTVIAEVSLYSLGFSNAKELAARVVLTFKLCSELLSEQPHYEYGMRAVKAVITAAAHYRQLNAEEEDEFKIVLKALISVNLPKFIADDVPLFRGILQDMFPQTEESLSSEGTKERLARAIREKCLECNLQPTKWFVEKTLQLYEMVLIRTGIMLIGDPMSCKTQSFSILAEALTSLSEPTRSAPAAEYRTSLKVINPKSMTMVQLYGSFDSSTHEWTDGVLGRTFRDMATSSAEERRWIVFDGPVDSSWIENYNTVLDDSMKLCLMNGEIIPLARPWMTTLFEVSGLNHMSPSVVGRTGIAYYNSLSLGWMPLKKSFIDSLPAKLFDADRLECLGDMFEWLVPPVLRLIQKCSLFLPYSELHLIKCQLSLLSSLLGVTSSMKSGGAGKGRAGGPGSGGGGLGVKETGKDSGSASSVASSREEAIGQEVDLVQMQMAFLFSVLWGLCSTLTEEARYKFDQFFRNLLDGLVKGSPRPATFKLGRANLIPDHASVFEYALDPEKPGLWVRWVEQVSPSQIIAIEDGDAVIVPTAETVKQSFFLELALAQEMPLALVGHTGTGKSFVTNNFIRKLSKEKYITNVINFSARTGVTYTQEVIMSKLDRRRKGVFGPAMGKKCLVFVDDLNLPQVDAVGCIPPVELLRQWNDHGYWYEHKDGSKMELLDVLLITAISPPETSGRNEVSPRFLRHMNILSIDRFKDETLRRIFTAELGWHFKSGYEMSINQFSSAIVEATLALYKSVLSSFLPTPTKCHYMFNLRDFAKVIQGIRLIPNTHLRDPNKLIRLWCHEVYRVFYDRLVDDEDRNDFFEVVKRFCQEEFKVDLGKTLFPHVMAGASVVTDDHLRSLCFGDYMYPEAEKRVYDEIPDVTLLTKAMEHYLKEYNALSKAPMPLVMFRYAVEHTSRINRVVRQKGGHALLVGLGGSGRQSLAKLAAFIAGFDLFRIEVNKTYGVSHWRNDLKRVLKRAGADCKQIVFLLNDQQIKDESFLEDIAMVLNTGDVPNLFLPEEKADILERIQSSTSRGGSGGSGDLLGGGEGSFANLYTVFLQNVKRNLHIVLCMSPVGTAFRNRLRMFPALVNSCTIDWFTPWPNDALEMVAAKSLEDLDLDEDARRACVLMCVHFHQSVGLASDRYLRELGRRNYVTPTSYLALIATFKSLLKGKRDEILSLKTRYEMGLGKLEFASSQVRY